MMMKTRHDERYENDKTPSREVVERYRDVIDEDDGDASLVLVHYRGGAEEFALGQEYCASEDPGDRATGACVLAQLGWSDRTFLDESVRILVPLLEDADNFVVSPEIREALRNALRDPDHEIRGEALVGLARRHDPSMVAELINEWKNDEVSFLSLEAAEESKDPRLHDHLRRLAGSLTLDDDPYFAEMLSNAINACAPDEKQSTQILKMF